MQQLADLQRSFAKALLDSDETLLRNEVVSDGISASERIDIYRSNILTTLTNVLESVYPVILRLVGNDYFRQVARGFVGRHPPRQRSLIAYGVEFPRYLATQPSAAAYPYLCDVARLEWACHQAFHAPDAKSSNFARLLDVPAKAWPGARVRLTPSLQLIQSDYPIDRIWRENQPDCLEPSLIELRFEETFTSVARRDVEVQLRSHPAAEFKFISMLKAGNRLQIAYAAAALTDNNLDIEALLRDWIEARLVVGFDPDWSER